MTRPTPVRRVVGFVLLAILAVACTADGGGPAAQDVVDPVAPDVVEPSDAPPPAPAAEPPAGPAGPDAAEWGANELGVVPVIMYHRIIEDGSEYDTSPDDLRAELTLLFERGFRPIRAVDLVDGNIDLPPGTSPVVLTFDDSSRSQLQFLEDGTLDPDSGVGILLEVAGEFRDVEPTASFYVLGSLFGQGAEVGAEHLRDLARLGFELGNHTHGHGNLGLLSPEESRRDLALGAQNIRDAVADVEVRTLSLPFGAYPDDPSVVAGGTHDDIEYGHDGVLLVGSGPSPSPFSVDFDPMRIPRIRSQPHHDPDAEPDFGSGYWLWVLDQEPERLFVSDGSPSHVSFPAELADRLEPRFAELANPY
ncbi:MAG: polysaccharide deacetylase family protein [Nitriliruptoraceae bacterium]